MPYSYFTFQQAKWALAQRLYDPGPHFMTDQEMGFYIIEALRTFNALANFYREEFVFKTEFNQPWYDIASNEMGLRPFTTSDLELIVLIELHLLEPVTLTRPLTWHGTNQFSFVDIFNAIQQARDKTLSESGCTVNQSLIAAVPGRTFLADNVMDVRRVCWIPNIFQSNYSPNCLLPSDLWAQQSFLAGFPQRGAGTPMEYRRSTEPPVSFDVDREPAVTGQWDILTTNSGGPLSLYDNTILPIPDDWFWVPKYYALAQLYGRESLAKDKLREDYCLQRYRMGIAAMQSAAAVLGARVNNVPVIVDSLTNGDFYNANWQGKLLSRPRHIYYSGLNLLAPVPIPDGVHSVTVSVVRNMPLPQVDSDFLQIGRDDYFPVLDLAQHIGMVKVGGAELVQTFPLLTNFLRHCKLYNSKLQAHSLWLEWLDRRPQEEIKVRPIFSPTADPVTEQGPGVSNG